MGTGKDIGRWDCTAKRGYRTVSLSSNKLYKYTNRIIFVKNNHTILEGDTAETYTRVDFLKRHSFSIPDIVEMTYKAKRTKGIKIIYHKDIRDLIKDIYKHV